MVVFLAEASGVARTRASSRTGRDLQGAEMRPSAAQEVAHAPHDAGGVVDLGHQVGEIAVGAAGVEGLGLHELLHRTGQRACRRHGLIDLVGDGRGHAAHHVHARGAGGLRLHLPDPFLRRTRERERARAIADDDADEEPRHGQHKHDDLKFGEGGGVVPVPAQDADERELGECKAEAGAVDPVADARRRRREGTAGRRTCRCPGCPRRR